MIKSGMATPMESIADLTKAKKENEGLVTAREETTTNPKFTNKQHKTNLDAEYEHIRQASLDPRVRFLDQYSDDKLIYYPVGKGMRDLDDDQIEVLSGSVCLSDNKFKPCDNFLGYVPQSKFLKANWPIKNAYRIDYNDGKIVQSTNVTRVEEAKLTSDLCLLETSDLRSLRSKERDLMQSPNDTVDEKQAEQGSDDGISLKERDFKTGVYIGQLDSTFKIKQGLGIRLYLKEAL